MTTEQTCWESLARRLELARKAPPRIARHYICELRSRLGDSLAWRVAVRYCEHLEAEAAEAAAQSN